MTELVPGSTGRRGGRPSNRTGMVESFAALRSRRQETLAMLTNGDLELIDLSVRAEPSIVAEEIGRSRSLVSTRLTKIASEFVEEVAPELKKVPRDRIIYVIFDVLTQGSTERYPPYTPRKPRGKK